MPYNSERHDRRSIRLEGWEYSWPGLYFVAICTHQRRHLFGRVAGEEMRLNAFGTIADKEWRRTAVVRDNVQLDSYVIMPNHVHGIIAIVEATHCTQRNTPSAQCVAPDSYDDTKRATRRVAPTEPRGPTPGSLGAIIGQYKSMVTKRINKHRGTPGDLVWQRNYYEHIIRTPRAHRMICAYIEDNPARWHLDRYNETAVRHDPRARQLWNMIT